MGRSRARANLVRLLQLAYSGELGAIRAYLGHRHSLPDRTERAEITKIIRDEVRHRRCLASMLEALGSAPDPYRERKMNRVGRAISAFCQVGGWFFPMYGAGRLESQNSVEYERAARLALVAGHETLIEEFLVMAEVEWDHERYFRSKAASHWLWRFVAQWPAPAPREEIRRRFAAYAASADRSHVEPVRTPWIVR